MKELDPVAITVKSYDSVLDKYTEAYLDITPWKHLLDQFASMLKGKKILDVGCGFGRDAAYLNKLGYEVEGIELSQRMIDKARELFPQIKVKKEDMRQINFPKASFDGLLVFTSFHHLPEKDASPTMKKFSEILKPTGVLYISVKEGEGEEYVSKSYYSNEKKFFKYYTKQSMKKILEENGFKLEDVKRSKGKHDNFLDFFAVKKAE